MQKLIFIVLILFFFENQYFYSQKLDSVQTIEAAIITSNRFHDFSSGTKIQIIDSASLRQHQSSTLAEILQNESPIFIKTYGMGGLATSSFRGASASHTALLWNGFNINSPMNGQFDLSLIPSHFINKVSIQYGGASTLWGSGAVGGVIHLGNTILYDKGVTSAVGASFGSFNNYQQNVLVELSKKKWITSIKVFNTTAKNNFPFFNTTFLNAPRQTQLNADLRQAGLLLENYLKINDRQKLNICFWYQHSDRNIPPIMIQAANKKNQKDESYRITSEWQNVSEKFSSFIRMAWFENYLHYTDSARNLQSIGRYKTFISEAESKIQVRKNHAINIGINTTLTIASSHNRFLLTSDNMPFNQIELADGRLNNVEQNRFAAFASYGFTFADKFRSTISIRKEMIATTVVPFTYSLGSEFVIYKGLTSKMNISKVYRIPTLNDMYWIPGGNINLLPESGFSEDLGLLWQFGSKLHFEFESTLFNRNMDNWIVWLPGQGYWSPRNIMEVWSRGLETRSEIFANLNAIKIGFSFRTNYVISTSEASKSENDASIGKQLIYVPMYSGSGKMSATYKNFTLSFTQNYTGYRYTSTDNLEFLNPYFLTNVFAEYKLRASSYLCSFFIRVNNAFSNEYQILLNHAMPSVYYNLGLTIQFNEPNN